MNTMRLSAHRVLQQAILLAALCWASGGASTPHARSQGAAAVLSPEAALVGLLPYRLTTDDVPTGYGVGRATVTTPLGDAVQEDDPQTALAQSLRDGFIVSFEQFAVPPAFDAGPLLVYSVQLMADAATARRLATQPLPSQERLGTTVDNADLGLRLGEAGVARRLSITRNSQSTPAGLYAVWQRDRLVFTALALQVPSRQASAPPVTDSALSILQAIDAKAARLAPPAIIAPAVPAPAGEEQRLAAYLRLKTLEISEDDAPAGYELSDEQVFHPAEFVITQDDPAAALLRIDGQWRRIIEAYQTFERTDGDTDGALIAAFALDADADAAIVDAQDIALPEGTVLLMIDPPVQLGDFTLAYRTGSDDSGRISVAASIQWTHGPLLLAATMTGPPGSISLEELTAFAQQIERVYQASGFEPAGAARTAVVDRQ